jgi:hypothetical protein
LLDTSLKRENAPSAASLRIRQPQSLEQAYVLLALLGLEDWEDNAIYARKIMRQIEYLKEAIQLFERNAPFSEIGDYEARLWISRLQEDISNGHRILERS